MFWNSKTNSWNFLKSCLFVQLTVFYRGYLGRKLLIQVRLICTCSCHTSKKREMLEIYLRHFLDFPPNLGIFRPFQVILGHFRQFYAIFRSNFPPIFFCQKSHLRHITCFLDVWFVFSFANICNIVPCHHHCFAFDQTTWDILKIVSFVIPKVFLS